MNHSGTAEQVLIEQQMLAHITSALKTVIDWKVMSNDASRKLSSLRFIAQSFQRHLERLMALEEVEGYMEEIEHSEPRLSKTIETLRQQHDQFRRSLRRIVPRLEQVMPNDRPALDGVCQELATLLTQLDEHSRKEIDVLQEALLHDEGGEG